MSDCPADMSGIHAPDEDGDCLNCDARQNHNESVIDSAGCYICQPNNPNAAEEGCAKCDRDHWAHVLRWAGR